MKQFQIGEAVGFGWQEVKNNFWVWVGIALIYSILSGIPYGVGFLLGAFLMAGLVLITLKCYDGKKLNFNDLFSQSKYFLDMLGSQLLIGLIVIGGLILLIVPGIYWALKYQFTGFFIVDKGMSITEAMHASGEMTKGIKWQLLLLGLAFGGIMILGALVFGVGILVAMPVIWLADAYVYRKLS